MSIVLNQMSILRHICKINKSVIFTLLFKKDTLIYVPIHTNMSQYVPNMNTKVPQIWITSRSPWNTEDVSRRAYFLILELIMLTNMGKYIPKHSPENIFGGDYWVHTAFFSANIVMEGTKKSHFFNELQYLSIFMFQYGMLQIQLLVLVAKYGSI